jgi:hypothetical protein
MIPLCLFLNHFTISFSPSGSWTDSAAYFCLKDRMFSITLAHPKTNVYLLLHKLCPDGGDAERNACIPHEGHFLLGPGDPWAHLAGARLDILPHLSQSGHAGGVGWAQKDQIRFWFTGSLG